MNQTPAEYRIEELRAKIPMSFGEKLKRYQDELKNLESINSPSPVINTSGVSKPQDTAKDSTTGTQARSLPELDHQDHSDQVTERAAIREFSGNQDRKKAEDEAIRETGPCYSCFGKRFWVS
ncbi:MAG: hypothetical protein ACD_28C00085G0001, partial [uncultured bacterium]